MNYKDFTLGDWIYHISGVIEDERELDGNEMRDLVEFLSRLPKWIPVSESLPNSEYGESDSVLVCFENETQDVLYFDGSNWCYPTGETYISVNHKNDWHNKVTAWMPLPKPYEPKALDDIENHYKDVLEQIK